MTDDKAKPREWWTDGIAIITEDEDYVADVIKEDLWQKYPIRVIEYSAFEAAVKERDELAKWNGVSELANDLLRTDINHLQEAIKMYDHQKAKVKVLREALESIACPSRPPLTDNNYWSIKQIADLVEIVITDTGIARQALAEVGSE